MKFLDFVKENIVVLDGGMGTLLQEKGLRPGEHPELWSICHKDDIISIHKAYFDAGSNVVTSNTFGANSLKFSDEELDDIVKNAISNVKTAADGKENRFAALDIGPLGRLIKPLGDLDFEDAVNVFKKTAVLGEKYGADLVIIETMNDSLETKAALLAVKEATSLPVIVSNAYSADSKLMTGATPEVMVAILEGMGADIIGVNCSLGPKQLFPVVEEYLNAASIPVLMMPNAGLPHDCCGKTVFDVLPEEFAEDVVSMVKKGVRAVGGCCGTTPAHIKALCDALEGITPCEITPKTETVVTSYSKSVKIGEGPILIGERINPTGKKRFKQALIENDINYILSEGINQEEKGVHILDVNVGLPDIDEAAMLKNTVYELQAVCSLPLQIDTADFAAMDGAMRIYNGKALINSVNGKEESMENVFPLVKKYGGTVIALTLDENGIPGTAEARFEIAKKILARANEYGIDKKDIVFDSLSMTVSADKSSAIETLKAIKLIKEKLGCSTSLGVSNVSFGLPKRDNINATFFACALENGLDCAIMNPYSQMMMRTYYSFRALHGMDDSFTDYIAFSESDIEEAVTGTTAAQQKPTEDYKSALQKAIIKGLKEQAAENTRELLKTEDPLSIIKNEIVPALDIVGADYEKGKSYLPQLLLSAESAGSAFEEIKAQMKSGDNRDGCEVVVATVKGDIHDIGKNIVKLLLENYGFRITDLGKDVSPETILEAVINKNAPLAVLSALMTTTVPAMEETVSLIHEKAPFCKVLVGGAVLNEDYASKINADKYAKDAMGAVRYAEEVNAGLKA